MSTTLYWLQCGGCGGDTMSLLNAESPDIVELFNLLDIEVLWHPSLSNTNIVEQRNLTERLISEEQRLDILCIEGSVIRGPNGTGMYDLRDGKPKKDLVGTLAKKAQFVLAMGSCASFGGITIAGGVEATGVQFFKSEKGGFIGEEFNSRSGLPVINLSGCPPHCDIMVGVLTALVSGTSLSLDEFNRPVQWYDLMEHQGCTRNEYHEYRVEEKEFGERGCLFFHMGCRGPLTRGQCNKVLWNRQSSKPRVGVPCFGCTDPEFPRPYPFFKTRNIEGIPIELPEGIDRAHYMAYKGIAAAAAPKRLTERKTGV